MNQMMLNPHDVVNTFPAATWVVTECSREDAFCITEEVNDDYPILLITVPVTVWCGETIILYVTPNKEIAICPSSDCSVMVEGLVTQVVNLIRSLGITWPIIADSAGD